MTRRALLEDPRLPAPILLPETLYLELTVGQLSAQETTIFDCPCIGDDLAAKGKTEVIFGPSTNSSMSWTNALILLPSEA